MQKKILCICTLLTTSIVAMKTSSKIPLQLTHQSPEITRVHSPEYLQWLENDTLARSLKSNQDFSKLLRFDLTYVRAVLNATHDVIQAKKESSIQPHYGISVIPEHYYGAGNALPRVFGDTYADIPIAVAHALQSHVFKRILIIDELFNKEEEVSDDEEKDDFDYIEHYYSKGNGSLFYPDKDKDSQLFNLFNGKVITSDKIKQSIDTFLETDGKDIDLIFYCPDMDGDALNSDNYISILKKYIPTIFILVDCPEEKQQNAIHHISTNILNRSKLNSHSFDVHYWSHTETEILENLEIQTVS